MATRDAPPAQGDIDHPLDAMLARLKGAIELGMAQALVLLLRLTRRRAGVAIVYHAIREHQGDPDTELVPPRHRSLFRRELRYLRRNYRPVPAAEFAAAVAARRRWQPFPVCVTFDDDLSSHREHALGPLREEDVPATFFLSGASLHGPSDFWWERLQRAADRGVRTGRVINLLPASAAKELDGDQLDIRAVAGAIQGLSPSERDDVGVRLLEVAGPDPPDSGLRAEAVSTLIAAGSAIGFHTRAHHPLVQLTNHQLECALSDGRDELEAILKRPIELIAYPHGAADRRVAQAAHQAGFQAGFTGQRCAMTASTDPMLIGRLVPDRKRSLEEFSLALGITLLIGPSLRATLARVRSLFPRRGRKSA